MSRTLAFSGVTTEAPTLENEFETEAVWLVRRNGQERHVGEGNDAPSVHHGIEDLLVLPIRRIEPDRNDTAVLDQSHADDVGIGRARVRLKIEQVLTAWFYEF